MIHFFCISLRIYALILLDDNMMSTKQIQHRMQEEAPTCFEEMQEFRNR